MSVLIKDMEMPEDGAYFCEVGVIDGVGTITFHTEERQVFRLVEVPDDVQPVKHGRWIQLTQNVEPTALKCSLCGEISCCRGMYCPDCGAKMDGEDNG